MPIQGKLPCDQCPWGQKCEICPGIKARKDTKLRDSHENGGFFSSSLVKTRDANGKEHYHYLNEE